MGQWQVRREAAVWKHRFGSSVLGARARFRQTGIKGRMRLGSLLTLQWTSALYTGTEEALPSFDLHRGLHSLGSSLTSELPKSLHVDNRRWHVSGAGNPPVSRFIFSCKTYESRRRQTPASLPLGREQPNLKSKHQLARWEAQAVNLEELRADGKLQFFGWQWEVETVPSWRPDPQLLIITLFMSLSDQRSTHLGEVSQEKLLYKHTGLFVLNEVLWMPLRN